MHPKDLRIADFTYDLPAERIAQHPFADRGASKLLIYRDGLVRDSRFGQLAEQLPAGTLLVLNDTRVVRARLRFKRASGAVIECMVMEPEDGRPMEVALLDRAPTRWWCMVGNAKRWKPEEVLAGDGPLGLRVSRVVERTGEQLLEFSWDAAVPFLDVLATCGQVPLPPYMHREADREDDGRYNTVFAEHDGSVAAPTASLHFTPGLMADWKLRNVDVARVTLHVGAGTFLPVKSERMADHRMHSEQVRIPKATVQHLLRTHGHGAIVPVGTTALRTIESLCWFGDDLLAGNDPPDLRLEQWRPYELPPRETHRALEAVLRWMDARNTDHVTGSTSVLIAPGYTFRLATGLITNFHQPGSTLLLLVAAFIGEDRHRIYAHALANGYRFLSYGDGSLLWRNVKSDAG